jgi:hypothetical protein
VTLIPLDPQDTTVPPVVFRRFDLPRMPTGCTAQYRSVERCRVVRAGVRELLRYVLADYRGGVASHEVTSVWVEEPMGPRNKATNALREVYGGILASIPPHIERAAIAPQEWRRVVLEEEHGHLDRAWQKDDSTDLADLYLHRHRKSRAGIDEHQAEALLIALAGRGLTWRAVEGAA